MNDNNIWVLDVGNNYNPELKNFDHHETGFHNDCTFTMLLKYWNLFEISIIVFTWLKALPIKDNNGNIGLETKFDIPHRAIGLLSSFIETTIIKEFEDEPVIKKNTLLFNIMELVGNFFLERINRYYKIKDIIDNEAEFKIIKNVPIIICISNEINDKYLFKKIVLKKKNQKWPSEKGGIIVYRHQRPKNSIKLEKINHDQRVDYSILRNDPIIEFIADNGYLAVIKDIPESKLNIYLEKVII